MIAWLVRIQSGPSPGNYLSFGTSFSKVCQLGAVNNCVTHTVTMSIYIYKRSVATGWLQTICFINITRFLAFMEASIDYTAFGI